MNPQKTQKIIIIKPNEYRVSYAYVCKRLQTFAYVHEIGRMRILGTMVSRLTRLMNLIFKSLSISSFTRAT